MPYTPLLDDNDQSETILNQRIQGLSNEEQYDVVGFQKRLWSTIVFHFLGAISVGFLYLVAYWKPDWELLWKSKKSSLKDADTLILTDIDGLRHVVSISEEIILLNETLPSKYFSSIEENLANGYSFGSPQYPEISEKSRIIRYFHFQYIKYMWNFENNSFECFIGLGKNMDVGSLISDYRGFSVQQQIQRQIFFGKNKIVVEVKSYVKLLFTEVLNPFYIFQIASIILWCLDEYYQYAVCIFIISCLSIGVSLYETRKQSEILQKMVESSNSNTVFIRSVDDSQPARTDASEIVPGDVIVIPTTGCVMACDAVLISGTAIVNESMLTGESVPVTKTALTVSEEDEIYSPETHKRHTLFCGTTIIQTRYYGKAQVLAVVVRTGFSTAKGELVRSITYPRPVDFKFYKDAMKFICLLFSIALIGMGYSLYIHIIRKKPLMATIIRTLDIVTIVVPPALPAAMTVGTFYAQSRLRKLGIFCISPPRINIAGKTKLICFDKTGTLTEDGLEVWGVVGVDKGLAENIKMDVPTLQVEKLKDSDPLAVGLASCHSLTYVDGKLIGDPLDLEMFKSTKWTLTEAENGIDSYDSLVPTIVRAPLKEHKVLIVPEPKCTNYAQNETKNEEAQSRTESFPQVLDQILQESASSNHYDQVASTVVKPCHSDDYSMPLVTANIQETSFKVN